jgi:putative DNA primase/helicase
VIPFTETFLGSDADPAIRTSLRDLKGPHVQAVLTWLVKGAVLAVRDGLGELPEVVRQATDAYRNESGPIAAFIDDECVQGPDAFAKASALRDRYVEWTNRTHDRSALNPKAFGMALRQRFAVKDKNDGAYYLGIGLVAREVRHDPPF